MKLNDDYWSELYQKDETGWDIGAISTPLKEYFDQIEDKSLRILIPGCGNAYEAEYLLKSGFTNITLVDISKALVEQLENRLYPTYKDQLTLVHGDFFELKGIFDLIVEQTFFCALDPKMRRDYSVKMNQLLSDNGRLAGVMFNRNFGDDGPPFGGTKDEYVEHFSDHFNLKHFTDCYNSIPPREGSELFICLTKK